MVEQNRTPPRQQDIIAASRSKGAWRRYYDRAESEIDSQWEKWLWPMIAQSNFRVTLDFACGFGRNTRKLAEHAFKIYAVDVNPAAIEYFQNRFADNPSIIAILTDGHSLPSIADGTLTFIYSFDSVVHFDMDLIREYLLEFRRTMSSGATAFIHHSNLGTGTFGTNPAGRGNASAATFKQACEQAGFVIMDQQVINWGEHVNLDCITRFRKP
jgi:ubiquinone/menaquinone biosynthesis C-methylase UbiE